MLVIDLHTLKSIYFLNFVHQVFLNGRGTLNRQDIRRGNSTVAQRCASAYKVVLLNQDLLGQVDQVLALLARAAFNDNLTVTTLDLAVGYRTVDFRNHRRV